MHLSRYYLLFNCSTEGDNSFLYADTENVMLIALARLGKKFVTNISIFSNPKVEYAQRGPNSRTKWHKCILCQDTSQVLGYKMPIEIPLLLLNHDKKCCNLDEYA